MAIEIDAILTLLRTDGVEGPCRTVGYVPARPGNFRGAPGQNPDDYAAIGNSGVTIGTGIDLGAYTADQLSAYGLPEGLVNPLRPYMGLHKTAAIAKLAQNPLTISRDTAQLFDEAVICGDFKTLISPAFKRGSGHDLDRLPAQAQAVIFSCLYQYGPAGWRNAAPKTWGYMCALDWCAASHELCSGFSNSPYVLRRTIEGKRLRELC